MPEGSDCMKKCSYPKKCAYCSSTDAGADHWYWRTDSRYLAGGVWRCRQRKRDYCKQYRTKRNKCPDLREKFLEYQRKYAKSHRVRGRYKVYASIDRRLDRHGTIKWNDAKCLMAKPCFYCGTPNSGGLDRKNSSLGHSLRNVLPCCEKCNNILSDIPFKAKLLLKNGLKRIAESNLLKNWTIPTKRPYEDRRK